MFPFPPPNLASTNVRVAHTLTLKYNEADVQVWGKHELYMVSYSLKALL